jgi:cobalt-zinc-cadmium efflux system outer membrane protein
MVFPPLALRRLAWLGAAAAFVAFATGCAAPYDLTYPEPRPLGPVTASYVPTPIERVESENGAPNSVALAEPLTLDEAVALALAQNPDLRAAAHEVRAREGEAYQAARLPNPELEIDAEEFGGSGDRTGTDAAEVGAGVSQTIELGGDRRARAAVAARGAELGAWSFEAARLDLITRVHQAFASVLAAETRLALAEEQRDIAARFADAVTRRAEAGAISPLEARRSAVAAATAEATFGRARRALDAARARLAPLLGLPPGGLDVAGDLGRLDVVPPYEGLLPFLALNPDVARYRTALAQAEAQVALERARRIPDPTLRAGGTYFNEVGEAAVTAGVSIPIPLFDTNRGAIQAARARVSGTAAEAEAALLRAERDLAEAYGTYAAAAEAARILRDDALPNSRAAFEGIETGYREGEFDLLAVLDAQRALVETQNALADALADVAQSRAAVERLIATPLEAAADGVLPNPDNE